MLNRGYRRGYWQGVTAPIGEDLTIEVKDQIARLKIESDEDKAMLSRLARLMYWIALAYN